MPYQRITGLFILLYKKFQLILCATLKSLHNYLAEELALQYPYFLPKIFQFLRNALMVCLKHKLDRQCLLFTQVRGRWCCTAHYTHRLGDVGTVIQPYTTVENEGSENPFYKLRLINKCIWVYLYATISQSRQFLYPVDIIHHCVDHCTLANTYVEFAQVKTRTQAKFKRYLLKMC